MLASDRTNSRRRAGNSGLVRLRRFARDASFTVRAAPAASAKRLRHCLSDEVVSPLRSSREHREHASYQPSEPHERDLPTALALRTKRRRSAGHVAASHERRSSSCAAAVRACTWAAPRVSRVPRSRLG
jgi:hypothetical protein